MLPERDPVHAKPDPVRAETHHKEVRPCAPVVVVAHLHLAHRDRGGARIEDHLVQRGGVGLVLGAEVRAAHLKLLLDGECGVVPVVERQLEEVLARDVRDHVLLVEVAGEGGVDERRVVELGPLDEFGPRVWVSG